MSTRTYPLSGLHCNACVGRVTKKLEPLAAGVQVTLQPMQVVLTEPRADFDTLKTAVAGAGNYALLPAQAPAPAPDLPAAREPMSRAQDERGAGWLATYRPLLLILGYLLGASVLLQYGHGGTTSVGLEDTMRYFMAGFFLVFSFFKLLDIRAFADAYAGYDLLARRWHGWGRVYPFVELALGIAYLTHADPVITHGVTIAVMGFSAIGVIQAVSNRRRITCACLGTVFQLPMSTVTIVEDLGMVAMAVAMLAMGA
ncbi:MAG: Heavy metal transport/detoxification protein [Polaromonas sp.]|nr:Heavy metal transport/detoxification protein [Polaromonas sp.]